MRIKIGDKIIDANDEPVLIIFDDDKERQKVIANLKNMPDKKGLRKYCTFPSGMSVETVKQFMQLGELDLLSQAVPLEEADMSMIPVMGPGDIMGVHPESLK